jgi:uncharacterized protein involved in exopolysaccharide biosynthesis
VLKEGAFSGFIKRAIAILLISLCAAVVAFALSFFMPPRYRSTSTFHPEQASQSSAAANLPGILGLGSLGMMNQGNSPEYIVRLIRSRSLLEQLVRSPFSPMTLPEYYEVENQDDSISATIKSFRKDLRISIDRTPGIIRMDLEMKDPNLARAVASQILQLTGRMNSVLRQESNQDKGEFLQGRLEVASSNLQAIEDSLRTFLKSNRRLDSPDLIFEQKRLERRLSLEQELYMMLSREASSTEIDALDDLSRITIIDPPSLPAIPSAPRRTFIAFITFLSVGALVTTYQFRHLLTLK